jgi:hypothetical protein
MIERLHRRRPGERTARRRVPVPHGPRAGLEPAAPVTLPPDLATDSEPSLLGFPAEFEPVDRAEDVGPVQAEPQSVPDTAVRMVVRRRADLGAGSALALAGVAANVSLWLPWVAGERQTGLSLVARAVEVAGSGLGELPNRGLWQPVAIIVCGGLLAVLGLLVILPAHTHRLVGVLALLVALAASASVMALLAGAGWQAARFGPGLWSGAAVAAFGLLGAFKAMLTLPLVTAVGQERGLGR